MSVLDQNAIDLPMPRISEAGVADYVALLKDLAALAPSEALAGFDLDEAGYLEVARAWTAVMQADPDIATLIAAGLAKR